MSTRNLAGVVFLAILGIVVAAGIGLLTNAIAGDSIGLSASSLQPGRQLAPPQAESDREAAGKRADRREHERADTTTKATTTASTATAPTTTVPTTVPTATTTGELEPLDDNGGTSGSSDSSGSGSSGSGSSGSGSSGSGGFDD